jgi:hypothetical protein
MNLVEILNTNIPEAGPQARQSIMNAQQRLEMLRIKNPQEADLFSQQLAGAISRREDPSSILEGIGKSYGVSIGKPSVSQEQATVEDPRKKDALTAASIAEINALVERSSKSGNQFDPALAESIVTLAKYDPDKARDIAKSSFPILEEKKEAEPPKKSVADITFEQNASAALRFTKQLTDAIEKYGTFEMADPEGSAKLGQLPYQLAIAYAKTVDPTSVAREGEVDAAKKYLIPIGIGTRNETALSAAKSFKEDIEERVRKYKESTGSDISIDGIGTPPPEKKEEEKAIDDANSFFGKYKQAPATK